MTPRKDTRPAARAILVVLLLTLAWGTFAFGGVYPWAYVPLAALAVVLGVAGLLIRRRDRPPLAAFAIGSIALSAAILLQLVPLPAEALRLLSPGAVRFLSSYDLSYVVGASPDADPGTFVRPWHSLSLNPTLTATALALLIAWLLLAVGTASLVSVMGALPLVYGLTGLGVILAAVGVAQSAMTQDAHHPLVYGFWQPTYTHARPFGPFINPNHFAGWMLMVVPLTLGLFQDSLLRLADRMRRHRDNWMTAVNAPEFAVCGLAGGGLLIMGMALLMTGSRSGIGAFMLGSMAALWVLLKHQPSHAARVAMLAAVAVVVVSMWTWAGLTDSLAKFLGSSEGVSTIGGRETAWSDTLRIVRDFPLVGTGLNTYGLAMIRYQSAGDLHFEQAHNDYLQLASEGGLLLLIPAAALVAVVAREVRRRFREAPHAGTTYWIRIGAVVGILSIALQSLVEFSLQMPGNAAVLAVLVGLAVHRSPHLRLDPPDPPRADR